MQILISILRVKHVSSVRFSVLTGQSLLPSNLMFPESVARTQIFLKHMIVFWTGMKHKSE
jgi:hypothetical protein